MYHAPNIQVLCIFYLIWILIEEQTRTARDRKVRTQNCLAEELACFCHITLLIVPGPPLAWGMDLQDLGALSSVLLSRLP